MGVRIVFSLAFFSLHSVLAGELSILRSELESRLPRLEQEGGGAKTRAALAVLDIFDGWMAKDRAAGLHERAEREMRDLLRMASNELARLNRVRDGYERDYPTPHYVTSPIEIRGADIIGERIWPGGRRERGPVLLSGFGHFDEAQRDLKKFPLLGNHLLQMEIGPWDVMPAEDVRSVDAALAPFFEVAKRAEKANVQVCLLLSPHYFPDWARQKWPEVNACGKGSVFKFCLYDKHARQLIEEYLRLVIPKVRGTRARKYVCVEKEPAQDDHGSNCVLRAAWTHHLSKKFGTLQNLNAACGTSYGSFDEIVMPSDGTKSSKSRLTYEYLLFNRQAHAAFHRHVARIVKELAPELPVHCKIMMADNFQNLHSYFSVDPETFAEFSDYNGNDCYDWPPSSDAYGYANEWWWTAAGYDYQRSAADKPIFDTEIHLMMDRGKAPITPAHVYGSLWQQALHGMSLGTLWTWQRAYDDGKSDFNGLIVERPSCLKAWADCSLDLNRLADDLSPLRNARPTILVHWSSLSQILSGDRGGRFLNAYRAASFLGQPMGVATERMLGRLGKEGAIVRPFEEARVLLLPDCPDLPVDVQRGIDVLRRKGVKIVPCCGSDLELFAAFVRERTGWDLPSAPVVWSEKNWKPVFGVETHGYRNGGWTYLAAINHLSTNVVVRTEGAGIDLLSGRNCGSMVTLQPEQPVFLRYKSMSPFESAMWIGAPGNGTPAFEKEFAVTGAVASAKLRIAAPGFYEAILDGVRIGDRVLDPSPSDFSKRVLYVDLPISLTPGKHSLRLVLGHGWYDQRAIAGWDNHLDRWRAEPCVRAELEILSKDGHRSLIATDASWRQVRSPIAWDDLREGEIIDPGFVLPRPGMAVFAREVDGPRGRLVPMIHPPARVVREIPVRRMWPVRDGWMYDFGENVSGWARIRFAKDVRGKVVSIRYDERVQPDGEPTVHVEKSDVPHHREDPLWGTDARAIDCYVKTFASTNVLPGAAFQQDRFVLTGDEGDLYEPRFTYHGFRYIWIRGCSTAPNPVACVVQTDFPIKGTFDSSDADLNDLMRMADASYRSNFTDGIPTDCPHREKNGWTGDAQFASEFAQYAYDNTDAYLKWIDDLVDAQRHDGSIGGVVPSGCWGFWEKGLGCAWDAALAVIPWNLYVYRDDFRGIRTVYLPLVRYVEYIERTLGVNGLPDHGLGDWIPSDAYADRMFCGSAYYYGILKTTARIAETLGHFDESLKYEGLATRIRDNFNRVFYRGDGLYANGCQTEQALPITFGLVDATEMKRTGERLVEAVHSSADHMNFGVVGSKHVFRALSYLGRTDLAYKMLKQRTRPGYLVWRDAGSSTLWEDWETGFSRNHVMFADFACWVYQYLAGIRLPNGGSLAVPDPMVRGMRILVFDPHPVEGLDFVRATLRTPNGKLICGWRKETGSLLVELDIPRGMEIVVPGRGDIHLQEGCHRFALDLSLDAGKADLAAFVTPHVGTSATGHTTPAAAYPFGMVQAGPTTGTITWHYCSGYRYEDKTVTGYALTALSGTGFCEYNELQVLPFAGENVAMPMKREIDKTTEKAEPGYYAVRQSHDGVNVEIAAAKRAAIYRFRWDRGGQAKVLVNLPYGNGQRDGNQLAGSHDGKVTKLGDCRIEGEHFRTGCIMRRRIAFALEFSRPWTACEELPKEKSDELPRYVLSFDLKDGEVLFLKSAFSMTSPEAARKNLVSSIPNWDFEGVKSTTRAAWNDLLSRSVCEGTDEQKRNWYTSLYHLYFQPNDYSDAGEKPYYTTLSLWDTFRACHPWYSIVAPEVNAGAVDSFVRLYKTFGRLPVMSYGGMNFDCMIGNHSVPVIVDAFLKSGEADSSPLRDKECSSITSGQETASPFWHEVYAAIKNTLTVAHPGKPKENWDVYDKYGYFPYDCVDGEGVSRTFECAYDDWCAAQMAKGLGKTDDYAFFMKRAGYWKNVFDSSIGFAHGKSADGKWREPFDPFAFGHGAGRDNDFTEGNAFQYTWHVMHDVDGLVAAMGGREAALKKLETLFTADATAAGAPPDVTGLIGQYVHGNEPSHHVIYLFSLLGRPDLAAKYVREVFDKFYLPKPDGLCGNDDCGQMSAWYLFSAMGFYPFNPCGGEFVIGAPQVPKAQVKVKGDGGQWKSFTMTARGLSRENKYVKSVKWNGRPITDWRIRHADIVRGGELVFEMGAK